MNNGVLYLKENYLEPQERAIAKVIPKNIAREKSPFFSQNLHTTIYIMYKIHSSKI